MRSDVEARSSSFNPRPRMRANIIDCVATERLRSRFQSAPPYEGEQHNTSRRKNDIWFQSAPPYEGELRMPSYSHARFVFQSAPPYEGEPRRVRVFLRP